MAALGGGPPLAALREGLFTPPDPSGPDHVELRAMQRRGLVFERDGVWFASDVLDRAVELLSPLFEQHPEGVSVSEIRTSLGTTRKYAMPLLAHMDSAGMTRRQGDLRVPGPKWPERAAKRGWFVTTETSKLTEWNDTCGGRAAKWGGSPLSELVRNVAPEEVLPTPVFSSASHRSTTQRCSAFDDLALVSTTDFFPPLVDDPGDFGAVAAANVCSDVFAMGGRVSIALNVCAFPERMPTQVIAEILAAAAGGGRSGGRGGRWGAHHMQRRADLRLAVQGLVHPDAIMTKGGAMPVTC